MCRVHPKGVLSRGVATTGLQEMPDAWIRDDVTDERSKEVTDKLAWHLEDISWPGRGVRSEHPLYPKIADGIRANPQEHIDALVEAGVLHLRPDLCTVIHLSHNHRPGQYPDGPIFAAAGGGPFYEVSPSAAAPLAEEACAGTAAKPDAPDMRNLPQGTRVLYEGTIYRIGNACTRGVDGTDAEQTRYRLVSLPVMFAPATYCWASHDEIQLVVDTAKMEEVPA